MKAIATHRSLSVILLTGSLGVLAAVTPSAAAVTPREAHAALSGPPVTIGLLAPLTGTRADLGRWMDNGAKMAVQAVNAAGGVLGDPLRLVVQDDAADPVDAVPAAETLVNVDHIVAMVGPTSITAGAVLPIIDRANIPMLMFGGGAVFDHETDPHFFRMSPSDTEQADAMVLYAKSRGWDRIALAFGSSSGSQALVPPILAGAKKLGLKITANVVFTSGLSSYSSEIGKVFAGHPQVVLSQFNNTTAATVFSEVRAEGFSSTPWIGSNLWYDISWFKSVGAAVASGPIYITNSSTIGLGGAPYFLQLLKKDYGLTSPPNGATFMYDAVTVWALGADQAGTWKYPAVRRGILAVCCPPGIPVGNYARGYSLIKQHKKINYEGAASSVDFNRWDNVFGPFDILHYNRNGIAARLETLSAQQIEKAFAS
jgi:branched-chain amino acid transport system substrate-binding protein